jgi:hypothetical protein
MITATQTQTSSRPQRTADGLYLCPVCGEGYTRQADAAGCCEAGPNPPPWRMDDGNANELRLHSVWRSPLGPAWEALRERMAHRRAETDSQQAQGWAERPSR